MIYTGLSQAEDEPSESQHLKGQAKVTTSSYGLLLDEGGPCCQPSQFPVVGPAVASQRLTHQILPDPLGQASSTALEAERPERLLNSWLPFQTKA